MLKSIRLMQKSISLLLTSNRRCLFKLPPLFSCLFARAISLLLTMPDNKELPNNPRRNTFFSGRKQIISGTKPAILILILPVAKMTHFGKINSIVGVWFIKPYGWIARKNENGRKRGQSRKIFRQDIFGRVCKQFNIVHLKTKIIFPTFWNSKLFGSGSSGLWTGKVLP